MLEVQAWRSLVLQRLMSEQAKSLGLKAHDREIVLALQTSPPAQLANMPQFQTNGKFDATKYQQAMRDPANNWSGFEDAVRRQLPVRKLQERLISSIKLSEPELRESFRDRFERCVATVVMIGPNTEGAAPPPERRGPPARVREVQEPLRLGPAERPRGAGRAEALRRRRGARRPRAGAEPGRPRAPRRSFGALARDYSRARLRTRAESSIARSMCPSSAPRWRRKSRPWTPAASRTRCRTAAASCSFKVLARPNNPNTGRPGFRVAQIIIKVKPDTDSAARAVRGSRRAAHAGDARGARQGRRRRARSRRRAPATSTSTVHRPRSTACPRPPTGGSAPSSRT